MSEVKFVEISFVEALECVSKGEVVYLIVYGGESLRVLEGYVRTQDFHNYSHELGAATVQDKGVRLIYTSDKFVREVNEVTRDYREGDALGSIVDFDYGKIIAVYVCPKYKDTHVIYVHRVTESVEHLWFHDSLKVRVYE